LGFTADDFIIGYAGILGHAQGLEVILDAASRLGGYPAIKFLLVGEGPEKENLEKQKNKNSLNNVFFHPAVPKNKIFNIINSCDVMVIPLKKLELFKGAIPSKIFEALALEKPVLLGVDGEAKTLFIDEANAGIYFEPENVNRLSDAVLTLMASPEQCRELGTNGKKYVMEKFSRKKIASGLLEQLSSK
jgi:glycosyltransferase involved in cell wall biosynthesis